jgi:hypothetical protein
MQFNYNNSTLISFKVPVDHVPVILLENRNDFVALLDQVLIPIEHVVPTVQRATGDSTVF